MPIRRNSENAAAINDTARVAVYAAEELDEAEDQSAAAYGEPATVEAMRDEAYAEMQAEAEYQAAVRALMDEEAQMENAVDMDSQDYVAGEPAPADETSNSAMEDVEEALEQAAQPESEQEIPPLSLRVRIHSDNPTDDIAATADVEINGICIIRNVKVMNDDYGLAVVMPRTKMPDTGRIRDACVFPRREMRSRFDLAVLSAYQQEMGMTETHSEREGGIGMHM